MQLRQLPLSLAFVVLSTVVNAVPIQSETTPAAVTAPTEEEIVVWVTETYWPCGPPPPPPTTASIVLAAVTTGANSVSRGTAQKKADYDTIPVDGGDNSESVQQDPASTVEVATQDTTPTTTAADPQSIVPPEVTEPPTETEIPVYTLVHSTTSSADPVPFPETKLDAQFTVISFHTPSPVATTKSPAAYNANATTTTTTPLGPTMPIILPTYTTSNGTDASNATCTDLGEPDEYTPEEESSYWATATEPSFYYSDYTVMITVKSTSMVTVSNTAVAEAVATSTTVTTTTTSSASVDDSASTIMPFANSTRTYSIAGVSRAAVTDSDPATSEITMTLEPSTTLETITTTTTTPMATPATTADPSEETISGTTITYVDETTTTTLGSSTTTTTETVSPTDVAASNTGYDTTTTTTDIITSTIIVEETANAKIRRRILVTRS